MHFEGFCTRLIFCTWILKLKGCNHINFCFRCNKVKKFQVLFYLSCKFLFCLLKCSTKVKAFPLWVTLTEVWCYTWYQSWRLPDWVKFLKTIFKKVLEGSIFKNKAYFEKHDPQEPYIFLPVLFVLNLSFFVSACLKHLRYQRVFMYPVGFVNILRLGPPPQVQQTILLLYPLLVQLLFRRSVEILGPWVERISRELNHS